MLMVYKLYLGVGHQIEDDDHTPYHMLRFKRGLYLPVVYATTGFVGCMNLRIDYYLYGGNMVL